MLTSVGAVPLDGRCSSRIVSERAPVTLRPSDIAFSSEAVSPPRPSDPVISQFVPAEVAEVGTSTAALDSLELKLKYIPTPARITIRTSAATPIRTPFGRAQPRQPRRPPLAIDRGGG